MRTLFISILALLVSATVVRAQDSQPDPSRAGRELYRDARDMLRDDDFENAVEAFGRLRSEFPESRYVDDSLYWEAFALYRVGDAQSLRDAANRLETMWQDFPDTAEDGEGEDLAIQITRQLARKGDSEAADRLMAKARELVDGFDDDRDHGHDSDDDHDHDSDNDNDNDNDHDHDHDYNDDHAHDSRILALDALMQMSPERAFPIVQKVFEKKGREYRVLRKKAVFILANMKTREAMDLLVELAESDSDPDVRKDALFWLGQSGDDRALPLLEKILASTDDPGIQSQAIFGIAQSDDRTAWEILQRVAGDSKYDTEVRGNAIFWLGQDGDRDSFELLSGLYDQLDGELKDNVTFGMAQMDSRRSGEWLRGLVWNENESVERRANAIFWLGQRRNSSLEDLDGLYEKLEERELKDKVIFAYSQLGGRKAVQRLIQIAETEKDPELVSQAIFWLGQTDNDDAVDFLMRKILEED